MKNNVIRFTALFMVMVLMNCFVGCTTFLQSWNGKIDIPFETQNCSAKELCSYLLSFAKENNDLGQYDFAISKISILYDDEHTSVTLVEKGTDNPVIALATLEWKTKNFRMHHMGRESKLNSGVIDIAKWNVDSTDIEQILYDYWEQNGIESNIKIIHMHTSSYYGENENEVWSILYYLDNMLYDAVIDPYSGSIIESVLRTD